MSLFEVLLCTPTSVNLLAAWLLAGVHGHCSLLWVWCRSALRSALDHQLVMGMVYIGSHLLVGGFGVDQLSIISLLCSYSYQLLSAFWWVWCIIQAAVACLGGNISYALIIFPKGLI